MKHRLTSYNLSLWLMRLKGQRNSLMARSTVNDARHAIRQGPCDYSKRGLSNREGARNRRWREYEQTLAPVQVVEWPSMTIKTALVPKSSI